MHIEFRNKIALVCGSSQGIGYAIARQFASLGATVILMARNAETLQAILPTLSTEHRQTHLMITADFDSHDSITQAITTNIDLLSHVDILINNSGGPPGGSLLQTETDAFHVALQRLLMSSHSLSRAVSGGMKSRGFGRIINIISTSVKQPIDNLGVSNTIRGATASWAKTLATEVASSGITVNNVLPGATRTSRLEAIIERTSINTGKSRDEVESDMLREIPMKRFAESGDIANAVMFLASEYASYITGTSIIVDGGRTKAL
ncbi:MAG: SDR family oxidoreductase [Candidatus Kapabacteria bacterium]|nr:SDR family oxidoreductase [Candidatus Kapabacteria bacterium]